MNTQKKLGFTLSYDFLPSSFPASICPCNPRNKTENRILFFIFNPSFVCGNFYKYDNTSIKNTDHFGRYFFKRFCSYQI